MSGPLALGFGRIDITPPLSIPYLSFVPRQTPFAGVHDRLFARAMVADNGETRVAIVAADALGFSADVLGSGRDFIAEARARVAASAGVPASHVLLAATHAHSTPQTTHLARLLDVPEAGAWLDRLIDQLAAAASAAAAARRPARLTAGIGEAAGVAWNRRIVGEDGKLYRLPDRPARVRSEPRDAAVPVLLARGDGWHGVVCGFTCHPTTVQVQPLVSGDYPAYACGLVERELESATCLFLQGACGDVNPVRHTTDFDDVRRYGRIVGSEVLKQAARLSAPDVLAMSATIRVGRRTLALPVRSLPGREPYARLYESAGARMGQATGEAERAQARGDFQRAREVLRLVDLGSDDVRCEVQVVRLGEALIAAVPGELFCRFGLALKHASPARVTLVVGYANGYVGYLAGKEDYELGGYETSLGPWTRLAPGGTERLVEATTSLMQDVWNGVAHRGDEAG